MARRALVFSLLIIGCAVALAFHNVQLMVQSGPIQPPSPAWTFDWALSRTTNYSVVNNPNDLPMTLTLGTWSAPDQGNVSNAWLFSTVVIPAHSFSNVFAWCKGVVSIPFDFKFDYYPTANMGWSCAGMTGSVPASAHFSAFDDNRN